MDKVGKYLPPNAGVRFSTLPLNRKPYPNNDANIAK